MSRRGENIYKRKDGRWEARYIKEILADGSKKYASVYGKTYAEVKEKQQKLLSNKTLHRGETIILEDAYNCWINESKLHLKPNTIIKYEGIYRNHLCEIGNVRLDSICSDTVSMLTDSLIKKGLSNKTINDILIVLNMILNYYAERSGCSLPKIRYFHENKKKMRVLTLYEQKKLSNYLKNDIDIHKFGVLLAMYTGLRVGELCALKWEDFDECAISVNKTMMRIKTPENKTEIITAPPKSDSSVRQIPIPFEIRRHMAKLKKQNGYVLSYDEHEFTEPRLMQYKFEKYVEDCSLKDVTFHTLRHTFATRCIEAGVDAKTVSELLGHSDSKITLNCYVHSSFELKQHSIERMQKMLA